ncbi:hypothetical protein GCM10020221_34860 [Streptomyces thioluteus]|uniref:Uncharacterized protein n=1 Tax=Streptomyces thioluteus TaxID=66431 RepID=A0ABN3X5D3_STRTU
MTRGSFKPEIELDPEAVLDYLLPIIEPAQVDEFTFTRDWMRSQATRIADPRSPAYQLARQPQPAPGVLAHPPGDHEHHRGALSAGRGRCGCATRWRRGVPGLRGRRPGGVDCGQGDSRLSGRVGSAGGAGPFPHHQAESSRPSIALRLALEQSSQK